MQRVGQWARAAATAWRTSSTFAATFARPNRCTPLRSALAVPRRLPLPEQESSMSDGRKALAGFGWIAFGDWSNRLLGFLTTLVLAKLLSPADFGAVAVAVMTISMLQIFRDLGVSQALIYRRGDVAQAAGTGLIIIM